MACLACTNRFCCLGRAGTWTSWSCHVCGVAGRGRTTSFFRSCAMPCPLRPCSHHWPSGLPASWHTASLRRISDGHATSHRAGVGNQGRRICVVAPHQTNSTGMSLVRRGLGCLFEEPIDAAHLRHMAYEKFSTLIGMTNVLYGHGDTGHSYAGHKYVGP